MNSPTESRAGSLQQVHSGETILVILKHSLPTVTTRRKSSSGHHVGIRPEEPLTVEMDHVLGVFGDPDFRFPSNVGNERLHAAPVFESGDEYQPCLAADKTTP